MARTDVTVFDLSANALVGTEFDANKTAGIVDGHQFLNDGDVFLLATKTGTNGAITIPDQKRVGPGKDIVTDRSYTIELTDNPKVIGPFPPAIFNDPDGKVWVNYESAEETEFSIYPIKLVKAR